jgi:hypothetical protein
MKAILSILAVSTSIMFANSAISDFQWKNRLLIVSGATAELVKEIATEQEGIRERDLRVFVLSGEGEKKYPVDPELAVEFKKRLSPKAEEPMVYLIGKDSRTILRWSLEEFSFEKLYSSIDAMPMRQREMREDS